MVKKYIEWSAFCSKLFHDFCAGFLKKSEFKLRANKKDLQKQGMLKESLRKDYIQNY